MLIRNFTGNNILNLNFCRLEAIIKALMLQRFLYVPSERILAERLLSLGIIGGFAILGAIDYEKRVLYYHYLLIRGRRFTRALKMVRL